LGGLYRQMTFARFLLALALPLALAGCDCGPGGHDGGVDAGHPTDAGIPDGGWCALPNTMLHQGSLLHQEPSGDSHLTWLNIPDGYCAHQFASVGNARAMRFAPTGELFVSSPTTGTTGGGLGGQAGIVLFADDDANGVADQLVPWRVGSLKSTQGMLFANDGHFYFQDHTKVMREPYVPGQRQPSHDPDQVADVQAFVDPLHWPKTLDQAEDGTIFVSNGGSQSEICDLSLPFHGGVLALDSSASNGVTQVAKGMRNPMYVRCHHDGHDLCFANELAKDYSADKGGREKLLPIHQGDDWGYPCCASNKLPYSDVCLTCSAQTESVGNSTPACMTAGMCSPNCDAVKPDDNAFLIGNTPFGFDFIDAQFPPPWNNQVIVALHGEFASWAAAKVVAIAMDPSTGLPMPSSTVTGAPLGAQQDFLTGWDDGKLDHGRPSDVVVSNDGRLFVSNDVTGEIFWVAPINP